MKKTVIITLLVLAITFGGLMYLIGVDASTVEEKSMAFAMAKMLSGLIVCWIIVGGAAMYYLRDQIRDYVQTLPFDWRLKFVVFAILLSCVEEAVTVTMTNLAPAFGSQIGAAHITASTNYFDVIFLHSTIAFVPVFVAWMLVLSRYDFSPFFVFIAYGFIGTVGEASILGPGAFMMFPVWCFVYGLMVYLPAYSLPPKEERGAATPELRHYLLAIPAVFVLAIPLIIPIFLVISVLFGHPGDHFISGS